MTDSKVETMVRPMTLADLDAIFMIDHRIRQKGQAITYAKLTTERIFTIDKHVGRLAKPVSYVDLIKKDVSELLKLGFVVEVRDHVRGFILGQVVHTGEAGTEVGEILILGVHPDYQRQGLAARLVTTLCEHYHSRGIKKISIGVDRRDKSLLEFVEHMGFSVGHLIDYTRSV